MLELLLEPVIAVLIAGGLFLIGTACFPGIYPPAQKALRFRAPKKLTQSQVVINQLAERIAPLLNLDPIKRSQTELSLQSLGHSETPEMFHAKAIAQSVVMAALCAVVAVFSVPLGIGVMVFTGFLFYRRQIMALERELLERRTLIERELPQFASTICQSLQSTRDVVAILRAYRRVCGHVLAGEIDKTLNDIMTGNAERAIRALDERIASPQLSQITRGLLAVMRGDDQRQQFEWMSEEFRKAQDEAVERMLLQRPQKLHPYMGVLFVFLVLMMGIALGTDIAESLKSFS